MGRYILTLSIICFITASLLTGVYLLTKPKIEEQKAQAERQALEQVMPGAEYFEAVPRDGKTSYFRAYDSAAQKKLLGYAFKAEGKGYSGTIVTMAGMDSQGNITGIKILEQNETPGLGARIEEVAVKKTLWEAIRERFTRAERPEEFPASPWFCAQFKGKEIKELKNVQAITGATISSEAVIDSVRRKAEEVWRYERK